MVSPPSAHPTPRRPVPFVWVALALAAVLVALLVVRLSSGKAVPGASGQPPTSSATSPGRSPSTDPSIPTPVGLASPPPCAYADSPAQLTGYDDWNRTLLDTTFRVGDDYVPPELVSTEEAGFEDGFLVRSVVIDDLEALREAAEADDAPLALIATYRSFDQQAELFERRVEELGEQVALSRAARPGHSEHQLGTAVDFKTPGADDVDQTWATSAQGTWLAANAYRFGFILSYPEGGMPLTCYDFEPWHYRYVGRDLAGAVHASGLTLRQYLWHWLATGSPPPA